METSRRARNSRGKYYDRKVKKEFCADVGTLVPVKDTPRATLTEASSLGPRWIGPTRITKKIGPVIYECQETSIP